MNFFEKVLNALEGTMNTPGNYGWFHIMFLIIVVVATVLLCKFFKDCSDTTFRKIIIIGWIVIVVLEIYKQLFLVLNILMVFLIGVILGMLSHSNYVLLHYMHYHLLLS